MKKVFNGLLAGLLLLAVGCSDSDERNHPLYKRGENALSAGNGQDAVNYFSKLLSRRPDAYLVHLRLASTYDELLDDPLRAVMHYKLYLEAVPDAPDAQEVKAWLAQCEKRCYENLHARYGKTPAVASAVAPAPSVSSETPTGSDNAGETATQTAGSGSENTPSEPAPGVAAAGDVQSGELRALQAKLAQYQARHRLMVLELERMRKKIKSQVAAVDSPAAENSVEAEKVSAKAAAETASPVPAVRTYTVVAGDTPGKIARKFYGKSSLYRVILRANPQIDERKLRPGMVLTIPEKTVR